MPESGSNIVNQDSLRMRMVAQAEEKPRSFAWFMQHALYDPAEGYYGSGRAAIGQAGDFITSVRPAFSRLLMWQFAEMWENLGRPTDFKIVEQGAHDGSFADGVLKAAEEDRTDFLSTLSYVIAEPSPVWRERQQAKLAGWNGKVEWCGNRLPPFTGVHFSNELIDAMPVRLVRFRSGVWRELRVLGAGRNFEIVEAEIECVMLNSRVARLPTDLPEGYTTEINLAMEDWIRDVAGALQRGYVLTADYGRDRESYFSPERTEGTLRGFSGHRRITRLDEILSQPGSIDITTDVEFSTLIETAHQAGLRLLGQADQHHFLVGTGRPEFSRIEADPGKMRDFLRSYQALIHPGTMGAAFHFICFGKDAPAELRGFEIIR